MATTIPDATGDPFPAPAWTHNAWPDWRGYRLFHVGENTLLAWLPSTGAFSFWEFRRDPPIGTSPLVKRLWERTWPGIRTDDDIVYLGGNRLLTWNRSTKRYRVWLLDRATPAGGDPLGAVPQTNGLWTDIDDTQRVLSLGGGLVLVWQPVSGKYRVYRHDPAAVGAADPLKGPIAQGNQPTIAGGDHQLIALGGDRVLDWTPRTGAFRVLMLDRALPAGDPFPGPPETTGEWLSIRDGHALVYLDGDRVLDWAPDSGQYKLWVYDRNVTTLRKATIRVHVRVLFKPPWVDLNRIMKQTGAMFGSYGLQVVEASRVDLTDVGDYSSFKTVEVGDCKRSEGPSDVVTELHRLLRRGGAHDKKDIFLVFARGMSSKVVGCASHPVDSPGIIIDSGQASDWTVAHELGHVLGLDHVVDDNRVMNGANTGRLQNLPPDLSGEEIAKMLTSPYLTVEPG